MTSPPRSVSQALLSPVRHVLASLRTNSCEGERFVGDEGGEDKREEIFARLEAHVENGLKKNTLSDGDIFELIRLTTAFGLEEVGTSNAGAALEAARYVLTGSSATAPNVEGPPLPALGAGATASATTGVASSSAGAGASKPADASAAGAEPKSSSADGGGVAATTGAATAEGAAAASAAAAGAASSPLRRYITSASSKPR